MIFLFLFSTNPFQSLPRPPCGTAFSQVTSDFLITRCKAVLYSLPLCPAAGISLSLEVFPCRFVLLHFWLRILCSLWWLFFLLSYHREPRDSVLGLLFFYLYSLSPFSPPSTMLPSSFSVPAKGWYHALNHSDLRIWSSLWLWFTLLIYQSSHAVSYFFRITPRHFHTLEIAIPSLEGI